MGQTSSASKPGLKADISRILKYAPAELIGRAAETKLLNDAWAKTQDHDPKRPRVVTIVALGGEGKTSLVAKWAAELAAQDWPGCEAAFAWSFYSQGTREQQAASSDLFLKAALTFFGDDADKAFAASPAGAFEKGQRLARLVGQRRSLLILDGLEPLQYAPTAPTPGELKDQGLAALPKGLASASHGLCVVTTRYSLPDLKAFWHTAPEVKLLRLSRDAGALMLKTLGVKGSELRNLPLKDGDETSEKVNEFEKLVEDVKGHALTLNLLGSYLHNAHAGDIRKRDLVKLEEADAESDHPHHAFHVLDAYVNWLEGRPLTPALSPDGGEGRGEGERARQMLALLRLLGLFDRPATADCLAALWTDFIPGLTEPLQGLSDAQRNLALKRLEDAKLLTVNRDASGALVSLDAHPHLREYFARQLRTQQPDAWRAAHRRLYEHLCASTPDKPQPALEDLQPLYQAVAHGCQAGLQQEALNGVYVARILRGNEINSGNKLGAIASDLGAVACFFESPWRHLSKQLKVRRATVLNEAAFNLRALGRLTESLEPMRAGLEDLVIRRDWKNAAVSASNLSELELTLGAVAGAVGDAEQSVTYADRSGGAFQRMVNRCTSADALHQAGRRAEAETRFREAEQMQKERQPDYPLLYSTYGVKNCDLLLAAPERAAWQRVLESRASVLECVRDSAALSDAGQCPPTLPSSGPSTAALSRTHSKTLREVQERAEKMFEWRVPGDSLLDIALDHLTLGRTALYLVILESPNSHLPTAISEIDAAVAGLRRAGTTHHIPRALLARAWLRFLDGKATGSESAQADLDEAWEIAERGPMKLFLVDIHLHRARFFFREKSYPWQSPQHDLSEARKLIEKCGYGRREEELEDAGKAILVT